MNKPDHVPIFSFEGEDYIKLDEFIDINKERLNLLNGIESFKDMYQHYLGVPPSVAHVMMLKDDMDKLRAENQRMKDEHQHQLRALASYCAGLEFGIQEEITAEQVSEEIFTFHDAEEREYILQRDAALAENRRLRDLLTAISTATIGKMESLYGTPFNHNCPYCLDMREMAKAAKEFRNG